MALCHQNRFSRSPRRFMLLVQLLIVTAAFCFCPVQTQDTSRVICYMNISEVAALMNMANRTEAKVCSHVIVTNLEKNTSVDYHKVWISNLRKMMDPSGEMLLSHEVTGSTDDGPTQKFVNQVKTMAFDGVDLDLRFSNAIDPQLAKIYREAFPSLITSATLGTEVFYHDRKEGLKTLASHVTMVNVPACSCLPPFESYEKLKSLVGDQKDANTNWYLASNNFLISEFYFYRIAGIPRDKLNFIIPIEGVACEFNGLQIDKVSSWSKKFALTKKEICNLPVMPLTKVQWKNNFLWVLYENQESVADKVCFAIHKMRYGGVGVTQLELLPEKEEEKVEELKETCKSLFPTMPIISSILMNHTLCKEEALPRPHVDDFLARKEMLTDLNNYLDTAKKYEGSQQRKCRPGDFFVFPVQQDCHRYLVCQWGEAVYHDCPPGMHFNGFLRACQLTKDGGGSWCKKPPKD